MAAAAAEAQRFWELSDAFSREETEQIRELFDGYVESNQSFMAIPPARAPWVYERMLALAARANSERGWGLLSEGRIAYTDQLIYDRFGPGFTDPEFKWHVDAGGGDPRQVSVVAYLSDAEEFEGGQFRMELPGEGVEGVEGEEGEGSERGERGGAKEERRDYTRGWAVAFPSKLLRHVVMPVTAGERRSFLLIVGNPASFGSWCVA